MNHFKYKLISALCLSTLALTGCDDDNSSMTSAPPAKASLSGTAAIGSPITNARIDLKCNGYNKTAAATTNAQGQWSANVAPANLPCVTRLTGGMVGTTPNTQTLYSITVGTGTSITTNMTPLSDLILAKTVQANTGSTLDNWYAGTTLAATLNTTITQLAANIATVLSQLTAQGYTLPTGTLNPFSTPFTATTTNSYDQLLEQIGQAIAASSSLTYAQFRTNYLAGTNFPTAPVVTPPTGGATCASISKPKASSSDLTQFVGTYQVKIGSATTAVPLTIAANGNISLNGQTATASDICGPFVQSNGQGLLILAKKTTEIKVNVFKDTANKITTEGPDFTSTSGDFFFGELGAPSATTCTTPSIETTFGSSTTTSPYTNGQKVCFTATATTLAFNSKTLINPVQNTVVSLPFTAYAFTDGSFKYEVIFNGSALHEINLMNGTTFVGQFAPESSTPTLCESSGADDKLGFKNAPSDFCSFTKASSVAITSPDIYTFFNADKKENVKVTVNGTTIQSVQIENNNYAWACGVGTLSACSGVTLSSTASYKQVSFNNTTLEVVFGTTQPLTVKNGLLIHPL